RKTSQDVFFFRLYILCFRSIVGRVSAAPPAVFAGGAGRNPANKTTKKAALWGRFAFFFLFYYFICF
ncbi:hypothetical protein ACVGWW_00150, partial [Enterobacter hormaechei]